MLCLNNYLRTLCLPLWLICFGIYQNNSVNIRYVPYTWKWRNDKLFYKTILCVKPNKMTRRFTYSEKGKAIAFEKHAASKSENQSSRSGYLRSHSEISFSTMNFTPTLKPNAFALWSMISFLSQRWNLRGKSYRYMRIKGFWTKKKDTFNTLKLFVTFNIHQYMSWLMMLITWR